MRGGHNERWTPPNGLRDQAETIWQARHDDLSATRSEDLASLVHDLEVHEIELELQNEQLRRAQEQLEESRQQLSDLYDFVPVGDLMIDQDCVIAEANLKAAQILGVECRQLVGKRFTAFVARESQDRFYTAQRTAHHDVPWSGELILRKADGAESSVWMKLASAGEPGGIPCWRCAVVDIATRHTAEQRVNSSEERYRRLAEQLVDGIFVIDSQGRYLDANHAGCEMLGYPLEELKTLTVRDVIAPAELPKLPEQFRRLAGEEIVRNEWCLKRKDGSTFFGELVARRLPDGRLQGVVRDLTEQKRSAHALVRQLEFERFLFELSRTFIGLPDEEVDVNMEHGLARVGEFLEMDRVTLLELSRDRRDMTIPYSWSAPGMSGGLDPVIPQSALPWWASQVLHGNVSLASQLDDLPSEAAIEKEFLGRQGITSAASIPLRVGGEIAGAISFLTIHRQVTWTEELVNQLRAIGDILWNALKRRQAMQALLAAQAGVRESEERFRLAMNNVAAGVFTIDLNGMVTYVNPAAEAMFGWTNAELLGKKMHEVTHYQHPDGTPYPASECPGLRILQTGIELREHEDTFIRRDGRFFPVVWSASPLKKDDTTVGIVVGFRDDTPRRDAERAMRESEALRARAEDTRRKEEFLAVVGHELRNPLAAIHAAMQVLSSDAPPVRRAKMEDIISRQAAMMRRLVDDLLELERITHGHIDLQLSRVDLAECLERAAAAVRPTVDSRQQELLLRLPAESVQLAADVTRLDQIVGNLLTNASKYTAPGGSIQLSGSREGADVVIRCKDNGQGILPENQPTIFEPFSRGPKTELGYGEASLGLGLALVKQLTELHGGTISVESGGAGLGTEFTVRLPFVAPLSVQDVADEPKPTRVWRRPRSIVLVEDNPSVAMALQAALEEAGHSVQLFTDGPSAISGVSSLKPDVLLIDIGLPEMDGYELAAKLKQQTTTQGALFVAISGFKRRELAEGGNRFDQYFDKPVDLVGLLTFLDQH